VVLLGSRFVARDLVVVATEEQRSEFYVIVVEGMSNDCRR